MDNITFWIDKQTHRAVKSEFYDEDRAKRYLCEHYDLSAATNVDRMLRPRRITVMAEGDDTRYIYESTDYQYNDDSINMDELILNQ